MIATLLTIAICGVIAAAGVFVPALLNGLFTGFDVAFGWLGGFGVVTLVSAGTGILFLLAFPHVSAQGAIVAVKDKIKHNLLGIRIFQDDMPTVGKGVFGSLSWNMAYLGLNVLPMIVLAAPFMVIWFQLNSLYAYQPLEVGQEKVTIVVELADKVKANEIDLDVPAGLDLVQRGNTSDRLVLVVDATTNGSHQLGLRYAGETVTKTVEVGTDPRRLARLRTATPFAKFAAAKDPILFFGDPVIDAGSFVTTITVPYAAAPLAFLPGGEIGIMLWFVVVSLVLGFALKSRFGVEF